MYRSNVLVCGGIGCTSSNSGEIINALEREIKARGLEKEVEVVKTGCFGLCALGPIMIVYPEGSFYSMVKVEDIPEIVEEHLLKGRIVKRLLYQETVDGDNITMAGLPFPHGMELLERELQKKGIVLSEVSWKR